MHRRGVQSILCLNTAPMLVLYIILRVEKQKNLFVSRYEIARLAAAFFK